MNRQLGRFIRDMKTKADALELPQLVEDAFSQYRDDPVRFCQQVLGVESATRLSNGEPYQLDVLEDLVDHPPVAVKSRSLTYHAQEVQDGDLHYAASLYAAGDREYQGKSQAARRSKASIPSHGS
jgi:hypothetical protein